MFTVIIQVFLDAVVDWINIVYKAISSKNLLQTMIVGIYDTSVLADKVPYIEGLEIAMMILAYGILIVNIYLLVIKMIGNGIHGERNKIIKSIFVVIIASTLIYYKKPVLMAVSGFFNFAMDKIFLLLGGVNIAEVKFYVSASLSDNMITLALLIGIALAEMRAIITYLERLITYMIYMMLYPISLAFSVSQESMQTFKEWFIGVLSQGFAIILSFTTLKIAMSMQGIAFSSGGSFIGAEEDKVLAYALCIVMYALSASTEKFLSPFGLKTMNHGSAGNMISIAAGTAVSAVSSAARATTRLGSKAINYGTVAKSERAIASAKNAPLETEKLRNLDVARGGNKNITRNNESIAKQKGREMAAKYSKMYGNTSQKSDDELRKIAEANGVFDTDSYRTVVGRNKKADMNTRRFEDFKDGFNSEMKERKSLSDNLNHAINNGEFMKDKDGNVKHMTSEDVARATNLDSTYPSFTPNPNSKAQILTDDKGNSAILINGTETVKGKEINKNIAIGKSDIAEGSTIANMRGKDFVGSQVELPVEKGSKLYTADSQGNPSDLYAYEANLDYIKPSKDVSNAYEAKQTMDANNQLLQSVGNNVYQTPNLSTDVNKAWDTKIKQDASDSISSNITTAYENGEFDKYGKVKVTSTPSYVAKESTPSIISDINLQDQINAGNIRLSDSSNILPPSGSSYSSELRESTHYANDIPVMSGIQNVELTESHATNNYQPNAVAPEQSTIINNYNQSDNNSVNNSHDKATERENVELYDNRKNDSYDDRDDKSISKDSEDDKRNIKTSDHIELEDNSDYNPFKDRE